MRRCLVCGKLALAGKAKCWIPYCAAAFLSCGVGKPLISDEYIRVAIARARAKVARVSEPMLVPAMPAVETYVAAVVVGDDGLGKEVEKRCFCQAEP